MRKTHLTSRSFVAAFAVAMLAMGAYSLAASAAALLTDDFNDNAQASFWYKVQPSTHVQVNEVNQRLEFTSDGTSPGFAAFGLRKTQLGVTHDFAFKADWHFAVVTGNGAELGMQLMTGSTGTLSSVGISAAWDSGSSSAVFKTRAVSKGIQGLQNSVARATTDGTLYVSYSAASDRLFLSVNGYWLPASSNGDWEYDGLLQGQWGASSLPVLLVGDMNATVNSGDAYLDNFEVTDGALVTPAVATLAVNATYNGGARIVTVQSGASPDNNGIQTGSTPLTLTYDKNWPAIMTAPISDGQGHVFSYWQVDGAALSTGLTVQPQAGTVTLDVNHTVTAVYGATTPLFQDPLTGTALAAWWYLAEASPTTVFFQPATDGLELQSTVDAIGSDAVTALRGRRLGTQADFQFQADWNFTAAGGNEVDLYLLAAPLAGDLFSNNVQVGVTYDSANGASFFVQALSAGSDALNGQANLISRTATTGTLYVSYDSVADILYMSTNGYRRVSDPANGDWELDGLVQSQWNGQSVGVMMGGFVNGVAVTAGQVFFNNFQITQGAIETPATMKLAFNTNTGAAAAMTVSPADNSGLADGTTPFTRTYDSGMIAYVTAPDAAGANTFQEWDLDGSFYDSVTETVADSAVAGTYTAVYASANPTVTLTLQSANPASGVTITANPADNNSVASGATPFTLTYPTGTAVTLVAPATASGNNFQKWQVNSVDYATTPTLNTVADADVTYTAVYVTPAAGVLSDNFSDNTQASFWYKLQKDANLQVSEVNQRLEAVGTNTGSSFAGYAVRQTQIDATKNFSVKANWHFNVATGDRADVGLRLATAVPGNDIVLRAQWNGLVAPNQILESKVKAGNASLYDDTLPNTITDGTFYISYDATLDRLYVSVNGYWLPSNPANGDFTYDGVVRGTWAAASVAPVLSADLTNGTLVSGDAYFAYFEITTGTMLVPPTATATVASLANGVASTTAITLYGPAPDNAGALAGSFATPFARTFDKTWPMTMVAPATDASSNAFTGWQVDGVTVSTDPAVAVNLDAAHSYTAVYGGTAGLFADNFDENIRTANWYQSQEDPAQAALAVQNQRLELTGAVTAAGQPAMFTLRQRRLDISAGATPGFQTQVAWHFTPASGNDVRLWLEVFGRQTDPVVGPDQFASFEVGYDTVNGSAIFAHVSSHQTDLVADYLANAATDGTLYISYDGTAKVLYLSINGYGLANNPATGDWAISLPLDQDTLAIQLGALVNGVAVASGDAYFDNFQIVQGTFATPPTSTIAVASDLGAGVAIGVSPTDNTETGDGATPFSRTFDYDVPIYLTAPATASGINFQTWSLNGVSLASGQTVLFTANAGGAYSADYTTAAATATLTIASQNPASGVAITITPADNNTLTDGTTAVSPALTRVYNIGTQVSLTAADTAPNGYVFQKWQLNGADFSTASTISVAANADVTYTAFYVDPASLGSLTVTLSPSGAISAGAQWNVDGGAWQNSGVTVTGLAAGSHTVSYKSILGWTAPVVEQATITGGATATLARSYIELTGSLVVTLGPAGAITAGAQWAVDGGAWENSGVTVSGLGVGNHVVSFKAVTGWNPPANVTEPVMANVTTQATGTYVVQTGNLMITLLPATAVTAGAEWRVDGGAYQLSGATVTGLSFGSHTVDYLAIPGYIAPPSETVMIQYNQTLSFTRTYILDNTPPAVVNLLPAAGAFNVEPNVVISLHVTDAGAGVDPATILVQCGVQDTPNVTPTLETIYDGATAVANPGGYSVYDATANTTVPGLGYASGTGADYQILFQPSLKFNYEDHVFVQVSATDLAGNAIVLPVANPNPPPAQIDPYDFTIATRSFGVNVRVDGGTPGDVFSAVATDPSGNFWVAWERDDAAQKGTIWLARRVSTAAKFDSEIQVTTAAANGDCHKPAIAIGTDGTIYVAYEVHDPILANQVDAVSKATTAAPTVWTSLGAVTDGEYTLHTSPAITVTSTGTVCVAGTGVVSPNQQIAVGTRAAAATAWTLTVITTDATNKADPAIVHDSTDVQYVIWTNLGDHNLYGADSTDFATIIQVTNTGNAGSPAIAVEATGTVLHFAWASTGGTPNPDIRYTATAGGWPTTPVTGISVMDATTGIFDASSPKVAVSGSAPTTDVFVIWKDRRTTTAGDTDIQFAELKRTGVFGTDIAVSFTVAGSGTLATAMATDPALALTAMGVPYAAWTDRREGGASHIYFSKSSLRVPFGTVWTGVTPAGGLGVFTDGTNPHFTEMDITIPAGALLTQRNIQVRELTDPSLLCLGGSSLYADGCGLYFDIGGGTDVTLSDWVTVAIHVPAGFTVPSPLVVYRLVPAATPADSPSWTTLLTQNVSYNATTRILTFETKHLSSFAAGTTAPAPAPASGGGGGGGGCAMSTSGPADLFTLLLPIVAIGLWFAMRFVGGKRSQV